MSKFPIAVLILLTVVVTTLPPVVGMVPADAGEEPDGRQAPDAPDRSPTPLSRDESSGEPGNEEDQKGPSSDHFASPADVWDGSSTRQVDRRSGLTVITSPAAGVRAVRPTDARPDSWSRGTGSRRVRLSEHCGLACRYAHAPPLD